jgi:hypothetical protein
MPARRWLPGRIAFAATLVLIFGDPAKAAGDGEPLAFCEVVTHVSSYAGKQVRLSAILADWSVLFDPACKAQSTWIDIEHPFKRSRKLKRLLSKDRRALVVVEGVFHAAEPYDIDPNLPEPFKKTLKSTPKRYGHLGSFSSMIEVSEVMSVKKVAKETPRW